LNPSEQALVSPLRPGDDYMDVGGRATQDAKAEGPGVREALTP